MRSATASKPSTGRRYTSCRSWRMKNSASRRSSRTGCSQPSWAGCSGAASTRCCTRASSVYCAGCWGKSTCGDCYNKGMPPSDPLDLFLPPVREWFRSTLGVPTAAQRQGWPAIAAGQNTLILAPTGSGKTLAAFLACLDGLWRQDPPPRGVKVLYVSPLKALNNDIHRNLQVPLEGVAETARQMGQPLPVIEAAVRTGDTSTAERQRLLRRPPHVLITTPESLHLLLTSRGRETLRGVTHCIVDEIHALCANKRGVFLALLLERLAALTPKGFVRIGLSATQRPLEEVARYLGGLEVHVDGTLRERPV